MDDKELLLKESQRGQELEDFFGSGPGRVMRERLYEQYVAAVHQCVEEAPVAGAKVKAIEELIGYIGQTVDRAKLARKTLKTLERGTEIEDWG